MEIHEGEQHLWWRVIKANFGLYTTWWYLDYGRESAWKRSSGNASLRVGLGQKVRF